MDPYVCAFLLQITTKRKLIIIFFHRRPPQPVCIDERRTISASSLSNFFVYIYSSRVELQYFSGVILYCSNKCIHGRERRELRVDLYVCSTTGLNTPSLSLYRARSLTNSRLINWRRLCTARVQANATKTLAKPRNTIISILIFFSFFLFLYYEL